MPAQLVTEQGPTSAAVFVLPDGADTALGRNPDNKLVLLDRHVSREHAVSPPATAGTFCTTTARPTARGWTAGKLECETPLRHGQVIRAGYVWLASVTCPTRPARCRPAFTLEPAWLSANDRAAVHLAETILEEGKLRPAAGAGRRAGGRRLSPRRCWNIAASRGRAPQRLLGAGSGRAAVARPVQPPDASTVMKLLPWSAEEEDLARPISFSRDAIAERWPRAPLSRRGKRRKQIRDPPEATSE